jgi:hypothetical protein
MNLGKLLGAGKSFVSGHSKAAYRSDKRVYLPQFVSPKNPFSNPATKIEHADSPKTALPDSAIQVKKTALSPWGKLETSSVASSVMAPAASSRSKTWASKFNPVSIFRDATTPSNKLTASVQTELSLEKVKVVHNDLTDADVEIVPIKSRPAREPAGGMPQAKKSWVTLGERIMKATAL